MAGNQKSSGKRRVVGTSISTMTATRMEKAKPLWQRPSFLAVFSAIVAVLVVFLPLDVHHFFSASTSVIAGVEDSSLSGTEYFEENFREENLTQSTIKITSRSSAQTDCKPVALSDDVLPGEGLEVEGESDLSQEGGDETPQQEEIESTAQEEAESTSEGEPESTQEVDSTSDDGTPQSLSEGKIEDKGESGATTDIDTYVRSTRTLDNASLADFDEDDIKLVDGVLYWVPTFHDPFYSIHSCGYRPEFYSYANVTEVLSNGTQYLIEKEKVMVMLNGQNFGALLSWPYIATEALDEGTVNATSQSMKNTSECLLDLAWYASYALGVLPGQAAKGLRLYSPLGVQITSRKDLEDCGRVVHLLVEGQEWMWPGVRVGHVLEVNGVRLETISLRPRAFLVENFVTEKECDRIIEEGSETLKRSYVVSQNQSDGEAMKVSDKRTSSTAFLPTSKFSRDLLRRTQTLLRLTSAGQTESPQLVKYEQDQFYKAHMDTLGGPHEQFAQSTPYEWYFNWASSLRDRINNMTSSEISIDIREGGPLHPDPFCLRRFQHNLLKAWMEDGPHSIHHYEQWRNWTATKIDSGEGALMTTILRERYDFFATIVDAWHKRAGPAFDDLRYRALVYDPAKDRVARYFEWIRWCKRRVWHLGDDAPAVVKPGAPYFPSFSSSFEVRIAKALLKSTVLPDSLGAINVHTWYNLLGKLTHDESNVAVTALVSRSERILRALFRLYEQIAGPEFAYSSEPSDMPYHDPNRMATLFLYLNDVPEGGRTVFPYSHETNRTHHTAEDETLEDQCSAGLSVAPVKSRGLLFYHRQPDGTLDTSAFHTGCPPQNGTVKYGANLFVWDVDSSEGVPKWMGTGGRT